MSPLAGVKQIDPITISGAQYPDRHETKTCYPNNTCCRLVQQLCVCALRDDKWGILGFVVLLAASWPEWLL